MMKFCTESMDFEETISAISNSTMAGALPSNMNSRADSNQFGMWLLSSALNVVLNACLAAHHI